MPFDEGFISLTDLGIAYRKAKVDLYYMNNNSSLQMLLEYEENLEQNLQRLYSAIHNDHPINLGGWIPFPSKITNPNKSDNHHLIFSDPKEAWRSSIAPENKPTAEFRISARPSIDFHVFSALWILKVGHKYDSLLSDNSYGNRLRRKLNGQLNPNSSGSFKKYLYPYRKWREDALRKIEEIKDSERFIVISTDLSSFYHNLNPEFLIKNNFLRFINDFGVRFDKNELNLTRKFIQFIETWAQTTPLKSGLPVGLPASAIIANVALFELDLTFQHTLLPIHYGRYVDDILLILKHESVFHSTSNLWNWIVNKSGGLLSIENNHKIRLKTNYLKKSNLYFSEDKTKIFMFQGESGQALAQILKQQMLEKTSEWRDLPELPDKPDEIKKDLINIVHENGEVVDSLSKAGSLTMRRSTFALRLRDIEAYAQDLEPKEWEQHRFEFIHFYLNHILILPHFFDFATFLPRIIRLIVFCQDFHLLTKLLEQLNLICICLKRDCNVTLKAVDSYIEDVVQLWKEQLNEVVSEALKTSFPIKLNKESNLNWKLFVDDVYAFNSRYSIFNNLFFLICGVRNFRNPPNAEQIKRKLKIYRNKLFNRDLANIPFRFCRPNNSVRLHREALDNIQIDLCPQMPFIESKLYESFSYLKQSYAQDQLVPFGLLFATRPHHLHELCLYFDLPNEQFLPIINNTMWALRGYPIQTNPSGFFDESTGQIEVFVDDHKIFEYIIDESNKNIIDQLNDEDIPTNLHNKFFINSIFLSSEAKVSIVKKNEIWKLVDQDKNWYLELFGSNLKALKKKSQKTKIAVTSFKTEENSFDLAIAKKYDLSLKRYNNFNHFINSILRSRSTPHYVIMPELSIPPQWFLRFAKKLHGKDISLISGVEYLHSHTNKIEIHHQVWSALTDYGFGFSSLFIYRQDKQRPAIHEEQELLMRGKTFLPLFGGWTNNTPPIVKHGDFYFAILICSELSNIEYRAHLRGKVDALFIPEWNQDIDSFNALVESSALDIHAYIIQCNNRTYGDSRIRAPYKDSWLRDVVRVKGGVHDYFVIGEIDIKSLRKFQIDAQSPPVLKPQKKKPHNNTFKPVPDGYVIDPVRNNFSGP
ncbi:MAG: RNA-directed DNA polymerase [Candidatus Sericytochromatia bacterium]|nr:RNA-directed DNA polymerase [Candidatus Sericytochromatia bacterium]